MVIISINQSINQSIFECIMPHGTRAQVGPKQHYTNNPHIHNKTVDLDNVSFTYIQFSLQFSQGLAEHKAFSPALHAKTGLPHGVDNRCCLMVVARQAQNSCRGIFIRIGGMIMTVFQ